MAESVFAFEGRAPFFDLETVNGTACVRTSTKIHHVVFMRPEIIRCTLSDSC